MPTDKLTVSPRPAATTMAVILQQANAPILATDAIEDDDYLYPDIDTNSESKEDDDDDKC